MTPDVASKQHIDRSGYGVMPSSMSKTNNGLHFQSTQTQGHGTGSMYGSKSHNNSNMLHHHHQQLVGMSLQNTQQSIASTGPNNDS